jgi:WD40 repeat protein
VASGKELSTQADGHDAPIQAVSFSPDGRTLVTGGENEQIRLWDPATFRQLQLLKGRSANELSFAPDGQRLVIVEDEGDRARVLDLAGKRSDLELVPPGARACPGAAFAPDGKSVVTLSWRQGPAPARADAAVIHVWAGQTGQRQSELVVAAFHPWGLAVSPDGRWSALTGRSGGDREVERCLVFCDLVRNRERTLHLGDTNEAGTASFSPDGRLLATGCCNGSVRLWEVASGRAVATLNGHDRRGVVVAFAPGGRILASADGGSQFGDARRPRTIRFWDVASGKELARIGGHDSDVLALAFSPDGKRLVAGLGNGTALVWDTPAAAKPPAVGRKLGPRELAALWGDLVSSDAAVAHDAVHILSAAPEQTVPFLTDKLRPAERPDAVCVRQLIAGLGSAKFAEREDALKELSALGEDVEAELVRALADHPAAEVAQRLRTLLTSLRNAPSSDRLREVRGVWVLELAGTPAADELLRELAKGHPEARLTREVKAALERRASP